MAHRLETLTKLFASTDEELEEEDVMAFQENLCRLGEMDLPTNIDYLARRDQTVTEQTKSTFYVSPVKNGRETASSVDLRRHQHINRRHVLRYRDFRHMFENAITA